MTATPNRTRGWDWRLTVTVRRLGPFTVGGRGDRRFLDRVFYFGGRRWGPGVSMGAHALVKQKSKRLVDELRVTIDLVNEMRGITKREAPSEPGDVAAHAEAMLDLLTRSRVSFRRSEQAAAMTLRALEDAAPFASMLERLFSGWQKMSREARPVISRAPPRAIGRNLHHPGAGPRAPTPAACCSCAGRSRPQRLGAG